MSRQSPDNEGYKPADLTPTEPAPPDPADLQLAPDKPLGYAWSLLFIVLLGLLAHGSTLTIIGASLREIADDMDASVSLLGWALTGAFLSQAIGSTIAGKLGDLYGHRRIYLIGSAIFVAGIFASGLAWGPLSLIGFRVLAGLGGSMMIPTGMAMIMIAFPPYARPRALGWFHAVATGGPAIGLAVGGSIVDLLGWRAVFFLYGPFALVGGVLAYMVFRPTPRQHGVSVDYFGAVLLAVIASSLLLAIDRGDALGFRHPFVIAMLVLFPLGLIVFLRVQSQKSMPLVPLEYFRLRNYSGPAVTMIVANFVYMGGFAITPLLLQDHFGFDLAVVTLLLLARPMTFSLASPFGGMMAQRAGESPAAVLGGFFMLLSMVIFALSPHIDMFFVVIIALVLSGACFGMVMPSMQIVVANTIPERDFGVAMGVIQTLSSLSVAAGIQTMLVVLGEARNPGAFTGAFLVGGVISLAGIVSASMIRSTMRHRQVVIPPPD